MCRIVTGFRTRPQAVSTPRSDNKKYQSLRFGVTGGVSTLSLTITGTSSGDRPPSPRLTKAPEYMILPNLRYRSRQDPKYGESKPGAKQSDMKRNPSGAYTANSLVNPRPTLFSHISTSITVSGDRWSAPTECEELSTNVKSGATPVLRGSLSASKASSVISCTDHWLSHPAVKLASRQARRTCSAASNVGARTVTSIWYGTPSYMLPRIVRATKRPPSLTRNSSDGMTTSPSHVCSDTTTNRCVTSSG
mmetsp:Transcript_16597/g.36710  ORF Transcript_16597/g.36710 Transcript_16597/m.36710 type:complete len:249 (-) Transcript_16597:633-1379(-)